ncbi:MAG: hypothetical protein KGL09_06510 [Pseudomonadota bacterium]|nr:hypothetical protein [Pseudomonadota bacterium]
MALGKQGVPTPTIAIESVLQLYVLNVAMWLAAWLTALHATLFPIGMAMRGAALAGLLPGFSGWLLSIAVLFLLLRHFTEASMDADIVLMVVVSRIIRALLIFHFL